MGEDVSVVLSEIRLKVMESVQEDVNKGIVKIDSSYLRKIGANPGDVVRINGMRATVAVVDRAYPGDIGLNIIRMDGNSRSNARTSVGEFVEVSTVEPAVASKVKLAPATKQVVVRASPQFFKIGLLGKAVVKGDLVSLGQSKRRGDIALPHAVNDIFSAMEDRFSGLGLGDLRFMVVEVEPKGVPIIIGRETEIELSTSIAKVSVEEMHLGVNYEDIGGLGEEIKKVREMIELPLRHPQIFDTLGIDPPRGVLLYGPPGTGKTLLAKAVASESGVHFMELKASDVISGIPGETEKTMQKIFEEAKENAPTILFIDELDSIAFKRQDRGTNEFLNTPVSELLKNLDGLTVRGKVVIIAATNRPNSLDPALRRPGRFDREIEIGVPDARGRLEILQIHTRNMPLSEDVNLERISEITHGFVGADVSALSKEAAMIVLRRLLPDLKLEGVEEGQEIPTEILEKLRIGQQDFLDALKTVRPSAMREVLVETPKVSWSDVGGLDEVKDRLKEAVEWPMKYKERFSRLGIRPPKGVLLYGPPGTGKTLLAKAVAKESEANFILVNSSSLQQEGLVGKEAEQLRKVFSRARQTSPSIVFFDEIDSFAKRRGTGSSAFSDSNESLLNQMLIEMDGLEDLCDVVVIAATNRPDVLDTALLRPGRFDSIILTPAPDQVGRLELFEIYTKGMPVSDDFDLEKLSKKTDGYVGADIQAVCREAGMIALRHDPKANKVTMDNLNEALEIIKASVDNDTKKVYDQIQDYFNSARAKEIKKEKASYFG
ncbi:CDC48 family AAA ATPase [archaeon]|jgi:transitional endoplasmic reticulum ATPase|nr:CDC48 family AAA ATPase [archaeon]MBT6762696.1 CDC48 family AAA ATPase [archaeon]